VWRLRHGTDETNRRPVVPIVRRRILLANAVHDHSVKGNFNWRCSPDGGAR
jgi:hypothetical protein